MQDIQVLIFFVIIFCYLLLKYLKLHATVQVYGHGGVLTGGQYGGTPGGGGGLVW